MVSRIIFAAVFVIVPIVLLAWLMLKKSKPVPAVDVQEEED